MTEYQVWWGETLLSSHDTQRDAQSARNQYQELCPWANLRVKRVSRTPRTFALAGRQFAVPQAWL